MRWLFLFLLLSVAPVAAETVQFLDCPSVAAFPEPCVVVEVVPETPPPPPAPAKQYPLFRKEEMAADTPELMLQLLREPTAANAERFLAWQQARQERITYVQHLLRTVPKPQPGVQP